jgi:hypothetical protein
MHYRSIVMLELNQPKSMEAAPSEVLTLARRLALAAYLSLGTVLYQDSRQAWGLAGYLCLDPSTVIS